MDCFLRFLQFDLLTLFCNPFKCEELQTKNSSIEMSGKDGKGEIEKTKNAKRPTPKTIDKAAKRRKCQRRTYCNLDTSADSENSFNEDYNDAYDVAESDCEEEDEEIVRNNSYCPNNSGYVRKYNDEGHPAECLPSTSKSSDCIIIENDGNHNGDDPNIGNMFVSKLHRSTADAELLLLSPSDSISETACDRCEECESNKNNEQEDEEIVRNNSYCPNSSGYVRSYNDEGHPAEYRPSTSKSSECTIIQNDDHDNGNDPNNRNMRVSELHRSTADAELFLLNPSDSINKAALIFCNNFLNIALKCSKMSMREKLETEEKAKKLFNKMRGRRGKYKYIKWDNLKLHQQIPFFWAALSDKDISYDPIENFQHFYLTFMPHSSNMSIKKLNEYSRVVWHDMNAKERLPFIMQAFIAKVASGEANVKDCDELQTFIERVENTTD
ncbi:uncharacterized protein LOC119638445 [Glossina fuscipes]|uniref:Uncharacterized protein LOC119638445 n=1 Tax=Glossina fuscipes TaxID=7396 RepID=A0A9C5Z366_9MUSC|nr:uncharacterized protein LOC119638445 [Glossina fuscipes]